MCIMLRHVSYWSIVCSCELAVVRYRGGMWGGQVMVYEYVFRKCAASILDPILPVV
jgi:hypothetical protein